MTKLLRNLAVILSPLLFMNCTKEDLTDCDIEQGVYIRVVDEFINTDITTDGKVDTVSLFIFDQDGNYKQTIGISAQEIKSKVPIKITTHVNSKRLKIAAWGNLPKSPTKSTPGTTLDGVALKLNKISDKYTESPKETFFGYKEISLQANQVNEMTINYKTAKLHVTVRGLGVAAQDKQHYFEIEQSYDGYALGGTPSNNITTYQEFATFSPRGDLSMNRATNLIHTIDSANDGVKVRLIAENGATLVTVNTFNGTPIKPKAGQTTNLMIDLSRGPELSQIELGLEVTPWDEIHQWAEW